MSGPTIQIGSGIPPEIGIAQDVGNTIEISDINDFDLGLLGNQRKLGTPTRSDSPVMRLGGASDIKPVDDIEVVDLDDAGVSFDVKPASGPSASDTIRILRDSGAPPPARPIDTLPSLNLSGPPQRVGIPTPGSSAEAAATGAKPQTSGWFSSLNPFSSGGGGSTATAAPKSSGWFSAGSSSTAAEKQPEYLTPEQEMAKKTEGLTLLERMDRKGIGGNKMTIANTLEEINAEVARRKDSKALEASLRFQRGMLQTVTSGLEFLNSRYDPLGLALDGWSENINENIEDYDEIFEELYDKYKDKTKVAPEVRLVMSLGLAAATCHITNTMFKSNMPGMGDILKKNPELARQMAQAAAEQAVGPGFANFVSLGGGGGGGSRMPPAPSPRPMPNVVNMMSEEREPMMPPMGGGMGGPIPSMDPRGGLEIGEPPMTARRQMRGPSTSTVDDILQTLNMNGRAPSRAVPPTAIDADEIASVASGMTSATDRRNGISRRRKVTQPTGQTLTLNV